jgi:tetratricopeptide (TPR) repeat protein
MIEHRGCCAAAGLGIDVSVIRGARRTAIGLAARVASSAVALLVASTLAALSQSAFDFTKSIDPLFAGVLAQPNNLNNTIQYAVTAASQGDIESAISAYEQLRFYNPMLAATRFQLAVLYYQLGSCDQARGYLQTALQMPDVTPELRQKIEDLLELVDKPA